MREMRATIYRAGQIIAQAGSGPEPEAFVVTGERSTAIDGPVELTERHPSAAVVDFGEAVIVPGFNDAHALVHHISLHWGVVNCAALHWLGIDETTADPDGGRWSARAAGRSSIHGHPDWNR